MFNIRQTNLETGVKTTMLGCNVNRDEADKWLAYYAKRTLECNVGRAKWGFSPLRVVYDIVERKTSYEPWLPVELRA